MQQDVLFSRENQLGLIGLNRPAALNALTTAMIEAIHHQLEVWEADDKIQAVIIHASPGRAFCAGGDVRWIYEAGKKNDPSQLEFFEKEYHLNYYIANYSKPYIALMDGMTMGGGVGVSLHGDFSVATENFVFAMPETAIGFFPDIGASFILSHQCPEAIGRYLGLTGRRLKAEAAYQAKLITHVMPQANIAAVLANLASSDLSSAPHAAVKACLDRHCSSVTKDRIIEAQDLIETCFQEDDIAAILAALSSSNATEAQALVSELKQKSPLSLNITLAQLKKAKALDLRGCLEMDYTLVRHFMRGHDFYEGVRALLVDKDKQCHWQPASLAEVRPEAVAAYFEKESALFVC